MNDQTSFQVVVSSENTHYMAWQTQLFCFSTLSRLGQHPIVIVHDSGRPLRAEFVALQRHGCHVMEAPSYRAHPAGDYPARNEVGSLLTLASMTNLGSEHILFCEPDMLFTQSPAYRAVMSGEYYGYMSYAEERVVRAAAKCGLDQLVDGLNATRKIGVPYLIPVRLLRRLASRWIEILDSFDEVKWIDIMYAFGLALECEGVTAELTRIVNHNYQPTNLLTGSVIHYCYGDHMWTKRAFFEERNPFEIPDELLPIGEAGTILAEMMNQLREARAFFRIDPGASETLTLEAKLCRTSSSPLTVLQKNDVIELHFLESVFPGQLYLEPVFLFIARNRSFTASDFPDVLSEDEKLQLARELIRKGVVNIVRPRISG
jgi:hypothetical protein